MHDYNGAGYDNLYPKTKSNMVLDGDTNLETKLKYYSNENLLDNWYFVGGGSQQGGGQFPINQRGQTNYSGAGYGIDRWKSDVSSVTTTINSDSIRISVSEIVAHGISQYFESDKIGGRTVTLSVMYKTPVGIVLWAYGSLRAILEPSSDWKVGSVTFTAPAGLDYTQWYVAISCGDSSYVDVKAAKLEYGDTQTLANQNANGNWVLNDPSPNYQQELAKCQYFYRKGYFNTTIGSNYDNTKSKFTLVVENMRAIPAVDIISIENQGWGDVDIENYHTEWNDSHGLDRYINYIGDNREEDAGKNITLVYIANADL